MIAVSVSERRKIWLKVPSRHAIRALEHAVHPMVQHVRNPIADASNNRPNRQTTRHFRCWHERGVVVLERYWVTTVAPSSMLELLADWLDPIATPDLLVMSAAVVLAVVATAALVEWVGVRVSQKKTLPRRQMTSSRRAEDRQTGACYRGASMHWAQVCWILVKRKRFYSMIF
jgi:hypothetical protein